MPYTTMNLTSQPVPFTVRRVVPGDQYGMRGALTHNGEGAMVEFYDQRYPDDNSIDPAFGQFVARYYESTLLKDEEKLLERGLNLEGRVNGWSINGEGMREVFDWVKSCQMHDELPDEQARNASSERPRA